MKACVIKRGNLGEPRKVFNTINCDIPNVEDDEVLVKIDITCIGHNTSWIARGVPVDVVKTDYHIAGSAGVGIVSKTGKSVTSISCHDEVFITCNMMVNNSLRILRYETPRGSFA